MSPDQSDGVSIRASYEYDEGRQWLRLEGKSVRAWLRSTESVRIKDMQ